MLKGAAPRRFRVVEGEVLATPHCWSLETPPPSQQEGDGKEKSNIWNGRFFHDFFFLVAARPCLRACLFPFLLRVHHYEKQIVDCEKQL